MKKIIMIVGVIIILSFSQIVEARWERNSYRGGHNAYYRSYYNHGNRGYNRSYHTYNRGYNNYYRGGSNYYRYGDNYYRSDSRVMFPIPIPFPPFIMWVQP
jgi:hypothetical protein